MKKYCLTTTIFIFIILIGVCASAQNTLGKTDDLERIALSVIVPRQVEGIPDHAQSLIESRLLQVATNAGLGGDELVSPFAITAKMEVLTKDITPTAPPMQAYTFEIYIYIVDNIEQIVLSSISMSAKGVGTNKNKAYTNAIRNIDFKSREFENFLNSGKGKIIRYYNSRCDVVIARAKSLAARKQFEDAIFTLATIPEVCEECYLKALDAIEPIYQDYIEFECESYLNIANVYFAANPNAIGASQAADILSLLTPGSTCFQNASDLISKIETKMRSDEDREWNFTERIWGDKVDLERRRINAYKEVGVAFGENQKSNYDVLWLFKD